MTARKQQPALFELINKGPLKPDRRGRLLTPKWFYRKKADAAATTDAADAPATASGADVSAVRPSPTVITPAPPPHKPASSLYHPAAGPVAQKPLSVSLAKERVEFSASLWLIGLIVLAAILILLVTYRLGQISMQNASADSTSQAASGSLEEIRSSEPRSDVLEPESAPPAPTRTAPQPDTTGTAESTTPAVTTIQAAPPTRATPAPATGTCLVLASGRARDLRALQSYFLQW